MRLFAAAELDVDVAVVVALAHDVTAAANLLVTLASVNLLVTPLQVGPYSRGTAPGT